MGEYPTRSNLIHNTFLLANSKYFFAYSEKNIKQRTMINYANIYYIQNSFDHCKGD